MRSAVLGVLVVTSCATILCAQQPPKAGGVTVSGHVFLADTNGPARMATVMLRPVEATGAAPADPKVNKITTSESVQTLLDGSFTIPDVQPGTYYVIASAPGYVSGLYGLHADDADPPKNDDKDKKAAPLATRITVQANLPASVSISLERGASVNGTVLYDDGSPAGGVHVQLLVRKKDKWESAPSLPFSESIASAVTDDRGHYRISGLPAGHNAVEVKLSLQRWTYQTRKGGGGVSMTNDMYSLGIYSGNHFRKKDVEGFTLTQGDERGGEDIEIPVSRLHTVRGNVIAAHDGHLLNGGRVALLYPDDKSELSSTGVSSDAEFSNFFVLGRETNGRASAERWATGLASAPIGNFVNEFLPDIASHIHVQIVIVQRIIKQVARAETGTTGGDGIGEP